MIDIIVPTFNQSAYTLDCFASIHRARGDLRIVWVDNGSDGHEFQRVHDMLAGGFAHPWTVHRFESNQGFVKATNRGLELLRPGADAVLQNNDTRSSVGLYERLAYHGESADIVGPLSTSGWQAVERVAKHWQWKPSPERAALDLVDADAVADYLASRFDRQAVAVGGPLAFFCTLIRRHVIERLGGLDEVFGVGLGDDDDYCARAVKAGFRVTLALDAFCWHAHRTTFKALYSPPQIAAMQERAAGILKERAQ